MKVKLTNPALDKGKDSLREDRGASRHFSAFALNWRSFRGVGPSSRNGTRGFRLVRNK